MDEDREERPGGAQSYTLVQFLLHGEGGDLRPGLGAYLRGAFTGKSGLSNLEKALGVDSKELERRWRAHVDAL